MPELMLPDDAAERAILKAEKKLAAAIREVNDSLVKSLRGADYTASGTVEVRVQIHRRSTRCVVGGRQKSFKCVVLG